MSDEQFDSIQDINAAGTLIGVHSSNIGVQVQVKPEEAQTEAAKRAGCKTTKQIIAAKFIRPINTAVNEARQVVTKPSLPFRFLPSVYWSSLALVPQIMVEWDAAYRRWENKVNIFIAMYTSHVLPEARERLGDFYVGTDYPDSSTLRKYFKLRISKFNLTGSSVAHAEDDLRDIISDFKEESRIVLREQMVGLLDHMVERLTPETDDNGNPKRKIFRDSMVTNLYDFLDKFRHLNISGDSDLNDQVQLVKNILDQRRLTRDDGPDRLRGNTGLANVVRDRFSDIRRVVSEGTGNAPGRRVLR